MKVMKIVRNGLAGALIASVPLSASMAATRPSAAIPVASSAVVAVQDDGNGGYGIAWPAVAVIAITAIVALWIILDDDGDGDSSLSRG